MLVNLVFYLNNLCINLQSIWTIKMEGDPTQKGIRNTLTGESALDLVQAISDPEQILVSERQLLIPTHWCSSIRLFLNKYECSWRGESPSLDASFWLLMGSTAIATRVKDKRPITTNNITHRYTQSTDVRRQHEPIIPIRDTTNKTIPITKIGPWT